MSGQARPAFYALSAGGWRDYVTLLHLPYSAWHLSYVAIGAGLAPELHPWRLLAALVAFFLAVGVAAHALDELQGRPLGTRIPREILLALTAVSLAGAAAIGVTVAAVADLWALLVFVAAGVFLVCAYNLELFGGRLHTDLWFAVAWGAFPLLTGYFVMAGALRVEALAGAAFATLLSLAQRRLSTQARTFRRSVAAVSGMVELRDGTSRPITSETFVGAPEEALRALTAATIALAAALLLVRSDWL